MLHELGISDPGEGDGEAPLSPLLIQVLHRVGTLAEAYAAGIRLTPRGCEYAGPMVTEMTPLDYETGEAWFTSGLMRAGYMCIQGDYVDHNYGMPTLMFRIRTPGETTDRLTYLLELSWIVERSDGLRIVLNSYANTVDFSPTDDGTQVALVELSGNEEHLLIIAQFAASRMPRYYFDWLNVVAL